jgi:hypothetical protein
MRVAQSIAALHAFAENWAKLTNGDQLPNPDSPPKRAENGGRMLKACRRAALVAVAAGAALAVQFTAIMPAQAAGPTVTIGASSKFKPVSHDIFVVYDAGAYSKAAIHGTITGAEGDVATLFAQQFPFKKAPVKVGSVALKTAKSSYSFPVTPTLYTKYAVRVFASKTATKVLATSRVQDVFVAIKQTFSAPVPKDCQVPVCHQAIKVDSFAPSSALGTEMAKHVYPYFGVNLNAKKLPPPPAYVTLNADHVRVTKTRRLSATEFTNTLTFSFTIDHDDATYVAFMCTKDVVFKDGLGLPGSHGCGARRISTLAPYVG